MKHFLLTFFSCLTVSYVVYSQQQITLKELIVIRSGDLDKSNQILLPKGWVFKGRQPHVVSAEEERCSYDELMWDNQSVLSSAYVVVKISKTCSNYVGCQTAEVNTFYAMRTELDKYSMRLLKTEVTEDKNGATWTTSVFTGKNMRSICQFGQTPTKQVIHTASACI